MKHRRSGFDMPPVKPPREQTWSSTEVYGLDPLRVLLFEAALDAVTLDADDQEMRYYVEKARQLWKLTEHAGDGANSNPSMGPDAEGVDP